MKNSLKIALFLILSSTLFAQNIKITVNGLENSMASLYSVGLEKSELIESINSDNSGQFQISTNKKLNIGIYRLVFYNKTWLNFVYDEKEIIIKTNMQKLLDELVVVKSDANKKYYKFLNLTSIYKKEIASLQKILEEKPNSDEKSAEAIKTFADIYEEYWLFINDFSQTENNSLISRYINSAQEPYWDISAKVKTEDVKKHFWDSIDFNDSGLLYTDLFINKIAEYLSYFDNSNQKKDLIQQEYENAIDIILEKAKANNFVYQRITEYLINGFNKLDLSNIVDYIVDNFVIADDLCIDFQTNNFIQIRIDQSKILKKGIKVPNIKLPNSTGDLVELYNINTEKLIILFYSSNCPHCHELLPQLLQLYTNRTNNEFEVLAVSLDTYYPDWQNYIESNKFTWINLSDLKGWKSKVSYDYYVYATPTMFLVDKYFKIVDKPKNLEELKTALSLMHPL